MTKQILNVFGGALIVIGIYGLFFDDALLGVTLNLRHEVLHLVAGSFAVWYARGSLRSAKNCAITCGAVFGLLGLAGILFGQPEVIPTWQMGMEPSPYFGLGIADHVLHIVYSAVFFIAAFKTKPMEIRTMQEA